MKLDRAAIRHDRPDILTADEAERPVIEIVSAEFVDHRAVRARRHKRIDVDALIEKDSGAAGRLIAVVPPDNPRAALRVVRLADALKQQHAHIVERESGDQHQVRWLLDFLPGCIGVSDARRPLARAVSLTRSTWESVRSSKFGFLMSTGRMTVCGLAFAKCSQA